MRSAIVSLILRQSDQVRTYLHAAFRYGRDCDLDPSNLANIKFGIPFNPVSDVRKPEGSKRVRDRELSRDEINTLWRALTTSNLNKKTVLAIKLVLTTGQRIKEEVLSAQWKEFDLENRLWTIPKSHTKNKQIHIVPLGGIAISLIKKSRRISDGKELLFPMRDDDGVPMPYRTLSQAIRRLCSQGVIDKFQPRDLRRTWKTRTGEIGLTKDVRDRIQNHAMHDVSSKHYDRYDYLKEKREAMEQWDRYLMKILKGSR